MSGAQSLLAEWPGSGDVEQGEQRAGQVGIFALRTGQLRLGWGQGLAAV